MNSFNSPQLAKHARKLKELSEIVAGHRLHILVHLAAVVQDLATGDQVVYFGHYYPSANLHLKTGIHAGKDMRGIRLMVVDNQLELVGEVVNGYAKIDYVLIHDQPDSLLLDLVAHVEKFYDDNQPDCLRK